MQIGYIETSGYFGIIPLFFALFAIGFARKQKIVQFLSVVFVVSLLLSLQGIGQVVYFLKIPLLTSGEGERILTITLFAGALLSGFGLSEFTSMHSKVKKIAGIVIFLFGFIFIIFAYTIYLKHNA